MGRRNRKVTYNGITMTAAARDKMLFEAHCLIADATTCEEIRELGKARRIANTTVDFAVWMVRKSGWEKAYSNTMA